MSPTTYDATDVALDLTAALTATLGTAGDEPHVEPDAEASSYSFVMQPGFEFSLAREDGLWIVADGRTGVHGVGDSVNDALNDFRTAVLEHVDVLERQDALSPELTAQLAYLRARL